ncbi:MAG: DUF6311 domain-containing protein [Rhodanobacter sp.]
MATALCKTPWLSSQNWSCVIPLAFGVLACLFVTGGLMLWPGNVQWLTHSDLAQSYLGWAFYWHAPWAMPPGANPTYGAGLHASIYYSDSIPLLAVFFKLFAPWLPEPFQYFGLWVLACFVLQAFFAWRLLGLATSQWIVRALGLLFFVLAPPMLMRLGGHMALVGHWTLLAAMYLCMRPSNRYQTVWWAALLATAMIIHAYLFAMVGAIWLADIVQRYRVALRAMPTDMRPGMRYWLVELCPAISATLLAGWLVGFFMVSGHGMKADGFGYYKMNLIAPFNGAGWSWFGLNMVEAPGEYEGFNYLGLGGIALIASALLAVVWRRDLSPMRLVPEPLLAIAVLLAVLAVSDNVGIGAMQWPLPLPSPLRTALSHLPLQSTGRLFWVAYYLLLLSAIFTLLRVFRGRWQIAVLLAAAILQWVDLYPGLTSMRTALLARSHEDTTVGLHGVFWDAAGDRYHTLRQLPTMLMAPGWEQLAFYAESHGMSTDAVQLARVDGDRFLPLYNRQRAALLADKLDLGTLYVLSDREAVVARAAIPEAHAALFRLDGRNVLAPGWNAALPPSAVDLRHAEPSPLFGLPFQTDLSEASTGRQVIGEGWNSLDPDEVTSISDVASLYVPGGNDAGRTVRVELSLHRASSGKFMAQQLEAWVDGRRMGSCRPAADGCKRFVLAIPATRNGTYFRELELRSEKPSAKLRVALDAIRVTQED